MGSGLFDDAGCACGVRRPPSVPLHGLRRQAGGAEGRGQRGLGERSAGAIGAPDRERLRLRARAPGERSLGRAGDRAELLWRSGRGRSRVPRHGGAPGDLRRSVRARPLELRVRRDDRARPAGRHAEPLLLRGRQRRRAMRADRDVRALRELRQGRKLLQRRRAARLERRDRLREPDLYRLADERRRRWLRAAGSDVAARGDADPPPRRA